MAFLRDAGSSSSISAKVQGLFSRNVPPSLMPLATLYLVT